MKKGIQRKWLKSLSLALFILIAVISFSGCATIVGKSAPSNVTIRSNPEHAKVKVTNSEGNLVYEGTTPAIVSLKKYDGYFSGQTYTMTFSKKGYLKYVATDGMQVNGWYIAGNLIIGGLVGWLIIDPMTGAMWSVNHHHILVSLSH